MALEVRALPEIAVREPVLPSFATIISFEREKERIKDEELGVLKAGLLLERRAMYDLLDEEIWRDDYVERFGDHD